MLRQSLIKVIEERADLLKSLEAVRHSIEKADGQDREELSNLLKLLEKDSKE